MEGARPAAARVTPPAEAVLQRRVAWLRRIALGAAVALPLACFAPELWHLTPDLNDGALHVGLAKNAADALREGRNPFDYWVPSWLGGYPLAHYYQPLPHLALALVHLATGAPLLLLLRLATLLALAATPLAVDRALRQLGLRPETACFGALLSCAVAGGSNYGIELESFTWGGAGLFTQAVALPALPLALAAGYRAVAGQGRPLVAAALLALTMLLHVLYGYLAAVSLVLVPFVLPDRAGLRQRLGRLALIGVQVAALTAFFVVPLALDRAHHGGSIFDPTSKYESFGAATILTRLFGGELLDRGRWPVVTLLAGVALYRGVLRAGVAPAHRFAAWGLVLWTCLYFGPATWGRLTVLLPLSGGLHFERLSNGVHLFAILLGAIALGELARRLIEASTAAAAAAWAAAIAAVLAPVGEERARVLLQNAAWVAGAERAHDAEIGELEPILARLEREPARTTFAGVSGGWGGAYRIGRVPVYQLLTARAVTTAGHAPFTWPLQTDPQMMFRAEDPLHYDVFGVEYLLTDRAALAPRGAELVQGSGRHRLYRVRGVDPMSVVAAPLAVAGPQEAIAYVSLSWLASRWPAERVAARLLPGARRAPSPGLEMVTALHYRTPDGPRPLWAPPGPFERVEPPPPVARLVPGPRSRDTASAEVELAGAAVLVHKVTFHPAWRVTIDGRPAEPVMVTPGHLGVVVPAGKHEVRFAYRPGWTKAILLAAGVALALALDRLSRRREAARA